jgi:nitroreductase
MVIINSYQVRLEEAAKRGEVSLEEAIERRKSRRSFKRTKLTKERLSQLIWAARKAPSAGATYPLELYVVIGAECVDDTDAGVYHIEQGSLELNEKGDVRDRCIL